MYSLLVAGLAILYFAFGILLLPRLGFFFHLPIIAIFLGIVILTLLSFSWQRTVNLFKLLRDRSSSPERARAILILLDDIDRHGRLLLEFAALVTLLALLTVLRFSWPKHSEMDMGRVGMGVATTLIPLVFVLLFRSLLLFPFTNHVRRALLEEKLKDIYPPSERD